MTDAFTPPFRLTAPQQMVVEHLQQGHTLFSSRIAEAPRAWINNARGQHQRWVSERTLVSLFEKKIIEPTVHEHHIDWRLTPMEQWVDV